ncbi:MAG TPA: hypothetical protein PKE21_02985 [Flavobacteriales bacterium]|nr:hypothetical protein [Flavobacteriales bacterium]HMR26421.1 hypothetical protein [Flavobacteriales bacterium]
MLLSAVHGVSAQEAVLSGGGDGDQGGGSIAFSIGQPVVEPLEDPSGTCGPGVQQPVLDPSTGAAEQAGAGAVHLAPNPAGDEAVLTLPTDRVDGSTLHLFDATGRELRVLRVAAARTVIDLRGLATGPLVLELRQHGRHDHILNLLHLAPR